MSNLMLINFINGTASTRAQAFEHQKIGIPFPLKGWVVRFSITSLKGLYSNLVDIFFLVLSAQIFNTIYKVTWWTIK